MSEHRAKIRWSLGTGDFKSREFSRAHTWTFDPDIEVPASSAPEYGGDADRVDPEQAFTAAVASCHMLTFLAVVASKRLLVRAYEDDPVGLLAKNEDGRLAMTRVTLRPRVTFDGDAPDAAQLEKLHALAHKNCFIANSVKCEVVIEG